MKKILLVLILLMVGSSAVAEPAMEKEDKVVTLRLKMNNSSNAVQSSPAKSRLKFKGKGPTCLCADGLSEKDIVEQQLIKQSEKE